MYLILALYGPLSVVSSPAFCSTSKIISFTIISGAIKSHIGKSASDRLIFGGSHQEATVSSICKN